MKLGKIAIYVLKIKDVLSVTKIALKMNLKIQTTVNVKVAIFLNLAQLAVKDVMLRAALNVIVINLLNQLKNAHLVQRAVFAMEKTWLVTLAIIKMATLVKNALIPLVQTVRLVKKMVAYLVPQVLIL